MKYYVINDKKDRVVAIIGHDYLTAYFICRSRSEAFTRAFYGVTRKESFGKLVTKKDHVFFNKIDPSYPLWMNSVLKSVCKQYWSISSEGEVPNCEAEVDDLVLRFFK